MEISCINQVTPSTNLMQDFNILVSGRENDLFIPWCHQHSHNICGNGDSYKAFGNGILFTNLAICKVRDDDDDRQDK